MLSSIRLARKALVAIAAIPAVSWAAPSPEARLEQTRAEVLSAVPAPGMLRRLPELLQLSRTFQTAGNPAKAGAALNVATIVALLGGDLRRAIVISDQAAKLCTKANDRRCYGNAMNQSGIALWRLNDPYAAMQRLDRGARAFRDAGDTERSAIARLNSANIRYDIGDLPGALADYNAIDRMYGNDPKWDPTGMLNSKAEVLIKLGRLADARQTARRAIVTLQQNQRSKGTRWESDVVNATRGTMALIEASEGNADAALPLYRDYIAAAERSGSPLERYNANIAFAEGLMKLGRPQEAYPRIRIALSLIGETDPAGRRDAYDLASRAAAAVGRTTEALEHLRAAEAVRIELAEATLRSAINDANAQTAVAEREAQVARRDAAWASQRTKLLGWTAFGVICMILGVVTLLARFRARSIEQRFAAVLSERTRMARELHDTLLQGFTGMTLQLRAASKSDAGRVRPLLSNMADEAGRWLSETRHAVWDMRAAIADSGLRTGLEQAVVTARTQSNAEIALEYALDKPPAPASTKALLRVAQEALSNAARHANAAHIRVSAHTKADRIVLTVRDDGVGFKAAPELSALGGHWGLLGMRERIEALGGVFSVNAQPGQGALVTAELPA